VVLDASRVDVPAEIGKWLLTLGTALAITRRAVGRDQTA
jgi:hypothetical protein